MNTLPREVAEFYDEGATELPVIVARAGQEQPQFDQRTVHLPARYNTADITWTDIERTLQEFGRNLEVTHREGFDYETTLARDGAVSRDGVAHAATIHSSYSTNPGNPYEDSLKFLTFLLDLQVYNGAPGTKYSSFFPQADARYSRETGSLMKMTDGQLRPHRLLEVCAEVLSQRVEKGNNISWLTSDDAYGMAVATSLGVGLVEEGHELKGVFYNNPADFYVANSSEPAVTAAAKRINELLRGNKKVSRLTPDPHWYDEERLVGDDDEKLSDASRQGLMEGYAETHDEELSGSQWSLGNGKKWNQKRKFDRDYRAHQARTGGEGFVADAKELLRRSPETSLSFVVQRPEDAVNAVKQIRALAAIVGHLATLQKGEASTQVYFAPGGLGMYPQKHFRGLWLGIMQDGLQIETSS